MSIYLSIKYISNRCISIYVYLFVSIAIYLLMILSIYLYVFTFFYQLPFLLIFPDQTFYPLHSDLWHLSWKYLYFIQGFGFVTFQPADPDLLDTDPPENVTAENLMTTLQIIGFGNFIENITKLGNKETNFHNGTNLKALFIECYC